MSGKFTDYLESFQVVCKLFKFYVHFPYNLESSQSVLKSFQIVWKPSRMSGEFLDCQDSSFIFQKVSAFCDMFLCLLESVPSFRQVKRVKRQSEKCCKHRLFQKNIENFHCLLKLFGLPGIWVKFPKWHSLTELKRVSVVYTKKYKANHKVCMKSQQQKTRLPKTLKCS